MFDTDKSKAIDVGELEGAMKALGLYKSKEKILELMEEADKDGSGTIEITEFMPMMARMIDERPVKAELSKAFKMYDDKDSGFIDFYNLKSVAE